jgi:hypothetical protein
MLNIIKAKFPNPAPASIYEREDKTPKTEKAHPGKGQALA